MTREDYDDVEGFAAIAFAGLIASGKIFGPEDIAKVAFDHAEALLAEKKKRLGEKPDYSG